MGKATVYLHIGTKKTGTSALQYFLLNNREVLTGKGIEYPAHPLDPNWISAGNGEALYRRLIEGDREQAKLFIEDILNDAPAKVVLSSEYFYSLDQNGIALLKELFSQVNVKIIVYLRRQDAFFASIYNQWIKRHNETSAIDQWITDRLNNKPLPYKPIEQWIQQFGKENVFIRIYEKKQFVGGSLFADFLEILGIDLTEEYQLPSKRINVGYRTDALEFMRLLNFLPPEFDPMQVDLLLQSYSEHKGTEGDWPYSLMSPADRHRVIEHFAEAGRIVAQDYLGRMDGCLFFDPLPDLNESWEPYPGLTENQVQQIANYIIGKHYLLSKQIGRAIRRALNSEKADVQEAAKTLTPGFACFILDHNSLKQSITKVIWSCRYRVQRIYHKLNRKRMKLKKSLKQHSKQNASF